MNKNLKSGICLLLVSALVLTSFAGLVAGTLPHERYGQAYIDAAQAPNGYTVTAWIYGTEYEADDTSEGDGSYQLYVPLDDLDDTTIKTGGANGETIFYMINTGTNKYLANEVSTFESGGIEAADLNFWVTGQPDMDIKINEIVLEPADAGNQYVYLYVPAGATLADWRLETHAGVIGSLDALTTAAHPTDAELLYVDLGGAPLGTGPGHLMLSWQASGGIAGNNWVTLDRVEYGDQAISPDNTIHPEYPTAPGAGEGLVRVTKGVDTDDSSVDFTIAGETGRPVTLTTTSSAGGSVTDPGEATYDYLYGDVVNIVATPDLNYHFVNWTGDVGTVLDVNAATTTITMNGDYTIQANFAINTHTLTTGSSAGGSVTTPGEGTYTYDYGTVVDIIATPDVGYSFVNWTGDVGTIADVNAATTTITMNGDYTIQANFAINTHTLTTGSSAGGSVTTPGEGTYTYDYGTVVDIIATPDVGYSFVNWTGDVGTIADVNAATTTITMNGDYTIQANFAEDVALVTPTGVWVEKSGNDLIVHWDDVGAPEYNVYWADSPYVDWSMVTPAATGVVGTSYTHVGALGGANYYTVRSSDGEIESDSSNIAFCREMSFTYNADYRLHYVSIPTGFNNMGTVTASDIVTHIEGGTGGANNVYIDQVVMWDYTQRDFTLVYRHTGFGWTGDNFVVEPGAAVGIFVTSSFTWDVNGTDITEQIPFTYNADARLHYISIPYTAVLPGTSDGILTASDIVTAIEGGTGGANNVYIDQVVQWDYTERGFELVYSHTGFGWTGDNFVVEPGATVGIFIRQNFDWTPELMDPNV